MLCASLCAPQDASYSARDTYSPPDEHGNKRMFLCRLALGAHHSVPFGYGGKEAPVRDEERLLGVGDLKYDTSTDGQLDATGVPQAMVAYKDNQALADYLLTFSFGVRT